MRTWMVAIIGLACFVVGVGVGVVAMLATGHVEATTVTGPVAIVRSPGVAQGYLGVVFSNEPARSLYVAEILVPAPAGADGLKAGDRVTAFNSQRVADCAALRPLVAATKPGDMVEVEVVRGDGERKLKLKLVGMAEMYEAMRPKPDGESGR